MGLWPTLGNENQIVVPAKAGTHCSLVDSRLRGNDECGAIFRGAYWLKATPLKAATPTELEVATGVRSPYLSIEKTAT